MYLRGLFLLAAFSTACSAASILDETRFIFAFGDSHTTEGWIGLGDPLLFQKPTFCWTAGPNWARQFQALTSKRLVNLAVSGATSDQDIIAGIPPDFKAQVDSFLTFIAPFPNKVAWTSTNSIFTVSFGTNDVNFSYKNTDDNGAALYSRVLDSYFATVDRLYAAGARRFLFNNVIPFDRIQRQDSSKLKGGIVEFNSQLSLKAKAFCGSRKDATCSVFDIYDLLTRIMDNFGNFGFSTADGICSSYALRNSCRVSPIVDPTCLGPVSVYVWKDLFHTTTTAHALWAKGVIGQLSATA